MKMNPRRMRLAWKYRRTLWKYRNIIRHRTEIIAGMAGVGIAVLLAGILTHRGQRL